MPGNPVNREELDPLQAIIDMDPGIQRGDVYAANLRDCAGKGEKTARPVLVIQNDTGNRYSDSIIVASISTEAIARYFPLVVEIPQGSIPGVAAICLNQITTLNKSCLGEKIAGLSAETMARVDEALLMSLGLPRVG